MDRWDVFQNEIEEEDLRDILTSMEVLRDEILFVLNNTDISSDRPFKFFKRLSHAIYYLKFTELGYDSTERLTNFLLDLLAGFSFISGDREEDIVEQMIRSI